jgi:hypothetical protein
MHMPREMQARHQPGQVALARDANVREKDADAIEDLLVELKIF